MFPTEGKVPAQKRTLRHLVDLNARHMRDSAKKDVRSSPQLLLIYGPHVLSIHKGWHSPLLSPTKVFSPLEAFSHFPWQSFPFCHNPLDRR